MNRITIFSVLLFFVFACSNNNKTNNKAQNDTLNKEKETTSTNELIGAGASFPYPLYSKMFSEYGKQTGLQINYQSIGSGGGIRQLTEKTIDFGASDAFLNDEDLKKMPAPVVHIPTCLGSVVIAYNVPGNPELKLTPDVLANIFLGKITKWNDKALTSINPGVKLPDTPIMVIHRSDGSGTTFIFTNYLSKVSEEWKTKIGNDKSVSWPTGLGGKGNEGVSGLVQQTPGAIGYVELAYAIQNKMVFALLKNKAGKFIKPSLESTTAAAKAEVPEDTRVTLTDSDAPEAYPISSFTWLLVYKEQNYNGRPEQKAKEIVKMLKWVIHDGQQYNNELMYAKLPENVVQKAEKAIETITYNGSPLK